MSKPLKKHKLTGIQRRYSGRWMSVCGRLFMTSQITDKWARVTCKNCLRCRLKPKGR